MRGGEAEQARRAVRAAHTPRRTALSRLVDGAWATIGLGFVPALGYALLGALLFVPLRAEGRHCWRLAREVLRPTGSRVVDVQGRTSLRALLSLAWELLKDLLDPDELFEREPPPGRTPIFTDRAKPKPTLRAHAWNALRIVGVLVGATLYATWFALPLVLFHLVVGLLQILTVVGAVFGLRHLALIPVAAFPLGFFIEREGAPPWIDVSVRRPRPRLPPDAEP